MPKGKYTIEQQRAIAEAEAKARLRQRTAVAPEPAPPPRSFNPIPSQGPIGFRVGDIAEPGTGPIDALQGVGSGFLDFIGGGLSSIAGGVAAAPVMFTHPDAAADIQQNVTESVHAPFKADSALGKDVAEGLTLPFVPIEKALDFAGEKTSDVTGSPGVGAGVKTALGSIPFALTRRGPRTARQDLAVEAQNNGMVVLPSDVTRKGVGAGEGPGGKTKTQQTASQRNTERAQELIREDLGMTADAPLDASNLAKYRAEQAQTYNSLRRQGDINFGTPFRRDLSGATAKLKKLEAEFEGITGANDLFKRVNELRNKQMLDADVVVDLIQIVRENADVAFTNGSRKLGSGWKDVANALENALENELQRRGNFGLVNQFRQSRQNIAKSYTVENALDKPNGSTVSIQKLAASKDPLTGNLEFLARFGSEFPKVSRVVNEAVPAFSPLDLAAMGPTGGLGALIHLTGGDPVATTIGLSPLIAQASRPMMRANALGFLGQRKAVTPPLTGRAPGIITGSQVGLLGLPDEPQ